MSEHEFTVLLHILGAAVLIGVVFFSLTLSIEKPLTTERLRMIKYLRPFGMYAAIWELITGIHLASADWDAFNHNPIFWSKMVLFLVDGVLAERIIKRKIELLEAKAAGEVAVKHDLLLWTWISVLVILTVVILGFWMDLHHVHGD